VVSLSSVEAEVYACSSGASDGILLSRLVGWLTGRRTWMFIYTDSSGAKGILQRQGVGRLPHLSCRVLWLQNLIASGSIILRSISGHTNPADIGTKRLSAGRMKSLKSVLGLFNNSTGASEGCDDPGRVFVRRQNIRSILCALSLLQLQGCDVESLEYGWSIIVTTMIIGFLMILPWMFSIFNRFWTSASTASDASTSTPLHVPTLQGTSIVGPSVFDQVDGESTPNEAIPGSADAAGAAGTATSSHLPVTGPHATDVSGMPFFETPADLPFPNEAWSPEAMLTWMYNRCLRRLDGCVGEERRTLYQQRRWSSKRSHASVQELRSRSTLRSVGHDAQHAGFIRGREFSIASDVFDSGCHRDGCCRTSFQHWISDCRYSPCWFKQRPPN